MLTREIAMMAVDRQQPTPAGQPPASPIHRARRKVAGFLAALAIGFGLAGIAAEPCRATAMSVTIDTTTLAGTGARLDFALLDGDFTANNSVTISNLATNGVLLGFDCSLGCAVGGPPPSFTVDDALGIGQFLQDLTLGGMISFDLVFSDNFSGINAPDRFTLNLLDSATNLSLVDTDLDFLSDPVPAQDALLLIDLRDGGQVLLASVTNPSTPIRLVPEPNTIVLFALGMLALAACRTRPVRRFVEFR
jgi:hypothetical protein